MQFILMLHHAATLGISAHMAFSWMNSRLEAGTSISPVHRNFAGEWEWLANGCSSGPTILEVINIVVLRPEAKEIIVLSGADTRADMRRFDRHLRNG